VKTTNFPLADAKLAVDIAAVRDQVSQLCDRLRYYDSRDKLKTVFAHLADAQQALGEAIADVLYVMEK